MCEKLGWVGAGTEFDILPLVLQASSSPHPKVFTIPSELVLQVALHHPKHLLDNGWINQSLWERLFKLTNCLIAFSYDWFSELGLRWYALPAVSSMAFDCGGLVFPAIPFNGWYMATEIGARDLADKKRYNKLEVFDQTSG